MEIQWDDGTTSTNDVISPAPVRTPADTLSATAAVNPDEEAEISRLSKTLGVTPGVVRLDLPYARRVAQAPAIGSIEQAAPSVAAKLSEDRVMAQASDDVPNLVEFEQAFRGIPKSRKYSLPRTLEYLDPVSVIKSNINFPASLGEKVMALINRGLESVPSSFWSTDPSGKSDFEGQTPGDVLRNYVTGPLQVGFEGYRKQTAQKPEERAKTYGGKLVEGVMSSPGQIITYGAPTVLSGGALGPILTMGGIGALDRGVTSEGEVQAGQLMKGAAEGGATGVALELSNYLPRIVRAPAVGALFGTITKLEGGDLSDAAASATTMAVLSLMGARNPNFARDLAGIKKGVIPSSLNKAAEEIHGIIERNPEQAKMSIKDGTFPEWIQGATERTMTAYEKKAQFIAAKDIMHKQSKLLERNPDMAAEIAQAVADDHGIPKMYLQADEVVKKMVEEHGMSPDEVVSTFQKYGASADDIATAMLRGGAIELDTGKVLSHSKEDPAFAYFQDDLVTDPHDVPVHGAEGVAQVNEAVVARVKQMAEAEQARTLTPDKAKDILYSLKTQLMAAGRTSQQADYQLALIKAYVDTWAAHPENAGKTAFDKLEQLGIQIEPMTRAKFEEKYGKLNADAGVVQKRTRAPETVPFTTVLRRRGGIDPAKASGMEGEVAALGKKESGTTGLVKKGGLSAEGALELAMQEGYLPEGSTLNDLFKLVDEHLRGEKSGKFKQIDALDAYGASFDPNGPLMQSEKVGGSREPWQMTREEFDNTYKQKARQFDTGFKDRKSGQILNTGPVHDIPEGYNEKNLIAGFIDKNTGEFLTREEAHKAVAPVEQTVDAARRYLEKYGKTWEPHKIYIEKALSEGKPVPLEVLKDYPDLMILAKEKGLLLQSGKNVVRGAIVPGEGKNIIHLFENANLSTFLHETGHLFLNDLRHEAVNNAFRVNEWAEVKKWLGIKDDNTPISVKQHERFARGFEKYLLDGEAPSSALREAFRAFRNWLMRLYGEFGSRLGVQVSPEIKTVFDKMLATDAQIEAERAFDADVLFTRAEVEKAGVKRGVVEELFGSLQAQKDRAAEQLNRLKKAGDLKGIRDLQAGWRKKAVAETEKTRFYNTVDFMRTRGIDREAAIAKYGKDVIGSLPRDMKLWRKDGISIDQAFIEANEHLKGKGLGEYGNVAEFLSDLASKPSKGEYIKARMNEMEIAFEGTPDVRAALDNAAKRQRLEIERQILDKMQRDALTGKPGAERSPLVPMAAIREWAKRTVADYRLDQMPDDYSLTGTSARLNRERQAAWAKGNVARAADLTEQLIRNNALAYEVRKARAEITEKRGSLNRMAQSDVEYGYRQQLNQLLLGADATKARLTIDENTPSLEKFIDTLVKVSENAETATFAELRPEGFAPWILAGRLKPVSEMTLSELRDFHDAARMIEKAGYDEKNGILLKQTHRMADFNAQNAAGTSGVKPMKKVADNSIWRGPQNALRKFLAGHDVFTYLTKMMDGFKSMPGSTEEGFFERTLFRALKEGEEGKDIEMANVTRAMLPAQEQIVKTIKKFGRKEFTHVDLPELLRDDNRRWTIRKIFSVAMNMGNRENLARLLKGYDMSLEDAHKLVGDVLTKQDLLAVQGVWDTISTLFPKIDEVHFRLHGFHLKAVKADEITFTLKGGEKVTLKGGYFPAVYDGVLSSKIGQWNEKLELLASQEAIYQTPSARSQFAKARAEGPPDLPIKLDLGVVYQHLNAATTYIHLAEAVKDFDRVTRYAPIQERLKKIMGRERYDMIRPSLVAMLRPEMAPELGTALRWVKNAGTAAALMWRTVTAFKQFDGAFPMANAVGKASYAAHMAKALAHPVDSYRFVMSASQYMRNRFGHMDADIARKMADFEPHWEIKGWTVTDLKNLGYIEIQAIDALTTIPGWLAAYDKAMKDYGGDTERAIHFADKAVSGTQGGSSRLERSKISNSKGIYGTFNWFMSNAMMMGSRQRYYHAAWKAGKMSTADYVMERAIEIYAPAVFTSMLMSYLQTGEAQDAEHLLADVVTARTRYLVGVRDVANSMARVVVDDIPAGRAMFTTPILKPIEVGILNPLDAVNKGDAEKIFWSMAEAASYATQVPVARVWKDFQKGWEQYNSGEGSAVNVIMPSKEKKK